MASSGMFRRVALVRTEVSEELIASITRMARIGELGTRLAVTSYRRTPPDLGWVWPCFRLFLQPFAATVPLLGHDHCL
jgi:hypothetical protein